MIINLNDFEKGKLVLLIQDKVTIEGLKKVFLKSFFKKREGDVNTKAAIAYAVEFLEEGFKDLENLVEKEKNQVERKNIV